GLYLSVDIHRDCRRLAAGGGAKDLRALVHCQRLRSAQTAVERYFVLSVLPVRPAVWGRRTVLRNLVPVVLQDRLLLRRLQVPSPSGREPRRRGWRAGH